MLRTSTWHSPPMDSFFHRGNAFLDGRNAWSEKKDFRVAGKRRGREEENPWQSSRKRFRNDRSSNFFDSKTVTRLEGSQSSSMSFWSRKRRSRDALISAAKRQRFLRHEGKELQNSFKSAGSQINSKALVAVSHSPYGPQTVSLSKLTCLTTDSIDRANNFIKEHALGTSRINHSDTRLVYDANKETSCRSLVVYRPREEILNIVKPKQHKENEDEADNDSDIEIIEVGNSSLGGGEFMEIE